MEFRNEYVSGMSQPLDVGLITKCYCLVLIIVESGFLYNPYNYYLNPPKLWIVAALLAKIYIQSNKKSKKTKIISFDGIIN